MVHSGSGAEVTDFSLICTRDVWTRKIPSLGHLVQHTNEFLRLNHYELVCLSITAHDYFKVGKRYVGSWVLRIRGNGRILKKGDRDVRAFISLIKGSCIGICNGLIMIRVLETHDHSH